MYTLWRSDQKVKEIAQDMQIDLDTVVIQPKNHRFRVAALAIIAQIRLAYVICEKRLLCVICLNDPDVPCRWFARVYWKKERDIMLMHRQKKQQMQQSSQPLH